MLKSDYEEGASVEACLKLAVKVLNKTMDSTTPTPEKMEFTTITRVNGKVGEDACSLGFYLQAGNFLEQSGSQTYRVWFWSVALCDVLITKRTGNT